eukprot:985803-Pyramimonas_sp.AAC.1
MRVKKRNQHEPGGYSAPWKKYAAAVADAIGEEVFDFSPTPEVSAPRERSRPRRWGDAPTDGPTVPMPPTVHLCPAQPWQR